MKRKVPNIRILAFPCHQFGNQEKMTAREYYEKYYTTYERSFTVMEKICVNGEREHPLYTYLKDRKKFGMFFKRLRWNFEKFLILGKNGKVIERFSPIQDADDILEYIKK